MLEQFLQRPSRHHLSALLPGTRAKVDDVVSLADGLFIVLHHYNAIALVLQTVQGAQQLRIVARVQTNGGLVEDVTYTAQVEPSCAARRRRCASPPDSVSLRRSSVR